MPPVNLILPLTAWRPDNSDFRSGNLKIARGCIKKADGFFPAAKLVSVTDSVLPNFEGADALFVGDDTSADQSYRTYAGTKDALYEATGTPLIWADVSRAGGYTVPAEGRWRTTQFGGDLFATNFNDAIQFVNVAAGGLWADTGAANIPKARYMDVVRSDFIFLGNIDDPIDGIVSNRIQWGPFRDPFGDWSDIATQADRTDIPDLGECTGMTGGEWGTALFRNGIVRFTYTPGGVEFFQADTISRQIGCDFPASVIRVGNITYFRSRAGWHLFDGSQVQDIGSEWVDQWTQDELRSGQEFRIQPGWDRDEEVIRWLFVGEGSQGDVPNRCLILKPDLGKQGWSYQDVDAYVLGQFVAPGTNLDLDPYPTLDSPLPPLDDPFWQSGNPTAGAINAIGEASTFKGEADDAVFTWPEGMVADAAQRVQLLAGLPITEGGSPVLNIATRNKLNDPLIAGTDVAPQANGDVALRTNARYQTITLKQSGAWESATGLQLSGVTTGAR